MRNILLSALALSGLTAFAAPPMHEEPSHSGELKEDAHKLFEENAPEGQKDAVPHFAILGKKDKFYLGIGGAVKVTLGEDWGAPLDNPNEFITADIQHPAPGDRNHFRLSAQQSSIYVHFVALPNDKNQVSAYIGLNFLNNYVPVLQNAYIKWRGLKAGYDYTAFSDNGAMPPSIDYEGPNCATAIPVPTISYTYSFGKGKNWSVTAGLELPQYSITPNKFTRSITQGAPDIPVSLKYQWGEGEDWIKASAVLRNLTYHNIPADKNVDIARWGVELSGTAAITPKLRAYWTGVYGRGIASYIQDLCGGNLDLTPKGEGIPLKAAPTWGAFGGLQYDFSHAIYASASYSHVRNYARPWSSQIAESEYAGQYKYAQYAIGNIFWNINPYITTGLEYIWGRRVDRDGSRAHTNRLQAMIQVSF